jgi:general secretion pathway protein K
VRQVALASATAQIRLEDEAGRVNPSTAPVGLLAALLRAVGADAGTAASLAGAIEQWRTPAGRGEGDTPAVAAYRAAGRSFGPSGAPFVSMDELGAVAGMTPELLARLAPHLTLFGEGDSDPRSPDPVVRQALAAATGVNPPRLRPDAAQIRVLAITVTAAGPDRSRFTRRAIVRFTDNGSEQGFRILAWDEPGDGA